MLTVSQGYIDGEHPVQFFTAIDTVKSVTDPPPTCNEFLAPERLTLTANAGDLEGNLDSYCEGVGCAWELRNSSEIDILRFNDRGWGILGASVLCQRR